MRLWDLQPLEKTPSRITRPLKLYLLPGNIRIKKDISPSWDNSFPLPLTPIKTTSGTQTKLLKLIDEGTQVDLRNFFSDDEPVLYSEDKKWGPIKVTLRLLRSFLENAARNKTSTFLISVPTGAFCINMLHIRLKKSFMQLLRQVHK
ncbi:hypothetical protein PUN28_009763 [Cardiocondyla obscurior]|uniref:Uncharacterized protein n=1 Tax=Cardiocondyla obscurior TaxID=286306 RepID=A0AAW2FNV0_9HYME